MLRFSRIKHLVALLKRGAQPSISRYLTDWTTEIPPEIERRAHVGSEWDDYWAAITEEFRLHPMSFLRQPVISRTVHPNQQDLACAYLDELSNEPFARENILPRLSDVPIGDPYLCEVFPLASPISIQHAYYLFLIKKHLDLFIPEGELCHILELGGGYGNFCRLACDFGYTGRYVIADLPEMHSIQSHFLRHALPQRMAKKPVEFRSLNDPAILSDQRPSLFLATFSLSEMPLAKRTEIEDYYRHFDYVFFAYNSAFSSVDNLAYFDELRNRLNDSFDTQAFQDKHRLAWFLLGRCRSLATADARYKKN